MKVEYSVNHKGIEVLKVQDYVLHSQYNPQREAESFVKNHYKEHYITILFGYGLGYIVDEFFKQMKFNENFIVIDPLLEKGIHLQERHKLYQRHFFDEMGISNLRQILGGITKDSETNIEVVCAPNYNHIFPEELIQLLKSVKEFQRTNFINENTLFRFAKEWQHNNFKNMYYMSCDASLKELEGAYDAPIVVASGGPSLTKQLPILKKYREKVILIAAGSTINSLFKYNISPDYVISIDGGNANYQHFKKGNFKDVTLLYMLLNHHGIRGNFETGYIFNSALYKNISKYLLDRFDFEVPNLIGGSTVAHYAFSIARYIANDGQIALIGQDLAYTNLQTHASGNTFAEEASQQFLKKKNAFLIPGYNGDEVWSDDVFIGMQRTFEEMIKFYPPDIPTYNCTEGGAEIKGFDKIPFETFCKRHAKKDVVKKAIVSSGIKKADMISKLEDDTKKYMKLITLYNQNLDIVKNSNNFSSQKKLDKLDKNDKKISKIIKELPIENILSPIILTVNKGFLEKTNETEEEKLDRTIAQSTLLYEQLQKVTKESRKWNNNLIQKLKENNIAD